ncbi:longitudinals lacking protein, isoforms H/M/V-like isoform X1 [Belonocnema kinseyi]|uniref:longitudinals lacking protein, isoforms H/M/V-like isoform X1 n=1 Tax=Belonocnema kinseyi TaxID=2817044 RepID=UPI00143D4F2C|nr:longitudinals lacking protein, isoforms H/M/V-like isoform X1 [Belonocnema kinseyi]
MSSQICLKWNSFLNNIATNFESLWEEEGLVDVTLASDGQCLTAHKVILSASSPFFKKVFQTNPCQHPVIILQDVHFSELEALLIFIYKGEVNIEQKNLPALLKAAETLQIRGLSGGDIFAKESYKRLAELEQDEAVESMIVQEDDVSRKKQKITKVQTNASLDNLSTFQIQSETAASECTTSEKSGDLEFTLPDASTSPACTNIEMKVEQLEVNTEENQRFSPSETDFQRFNTGLRDEHQRSSKPTVTIIAEARHTCSPSPETLSNPTFPDAEKDLRQHIPSNFVESSSLNSSSETRTLSKSDCLEPSVFPTNHNPTLSDSGFLFCANTSNSSQKNSESVESSHSPKGGPSYPPFPCPFCDRAYTSWGFRRRHIKAVHTISPRLSCKWCLQVLPTHGAWRRHVISAHNLSSSDAHNGLLILEEAHMVLQIAHPTRLDALVDIIKQGSHQNNERDFLQPDKDH